MKWNFNEGNCHRMYLYRVILILTWISKGLNFTKGISESNDEFALLMSLNLLDITDMQIKQKIIQILNKQRILCTGRNLCIINRGGWTQIIPSFTVEHLSRNRHIVQCWLISEQRYVLFYTAGTKEWQ